MKKFFKEYRIEMTAILIAFLGVFLLVERLEIRVTLINTALWFYETVINSIITGLANLGAYITSFTVSDFIGWVILILTGGFVLWRIRYRFLKSRRWLIEDCPSCDSPIERVHRTRFQRFLTWALLPHGRSYRCKDHDCSWSGLRHRVQPKHPSTPEELLDF